MKMRIILTILFALGTQIAIVVASDSKRRANENASCSDSEDLHKKSKKSEITGTWQPRQNFVQDVLGRSEAHFAGLSIQEQERIFKVLCRHNGFSAGIFSQQSLGDLRLHTLTTFAPLTPGSINIIEGDSPLAAAHEEMYARLDIGSLQASVGLVCQARGKRLTVMVASNSNCLETVSEYDVPSDITRYINDPTQGPAASISAAPGTLLRNYFINRPARVGDAGYQINLLDDLLSFFSYESDVVVPVNNGYLKLPPDPTILGQLATFVETNAHLIKVGVHTDISVSHGLRRGAEHYQLDRDSRPLINQIFCAALDLGQGTNARTPESERIAKVLLTAQIEATILAAIAANTEILILPLLGCGVFGNDPIWIVEALGSNQELIRASGMRVILNIFDNAALSYRPDLQGKLTGLAQRTGGSYLSYEHSAAGLRVNNLCTGFVRDTLDNIIGDLEAAKTVSSFSAR